MNRAGGGQSVELLLLRARLAQQGGLLQGRRISPTHLLGHRRDVATLGRLGRGVHRQGGRLVQGVFLAPEPFLQHVVLQVSLKIKAEPLGARVEHPLLLVVLQALGNGLGGTVEGVQTCADDVLRHAFAVGVHVEHVRPTDLLRLGLLVDHLLLHLVERGFGLDLIGLVLGILGYPGHLAGDLGHGATEGFHWVRDMPEEHRID